MLQLIYDILLLVGIAVYAMQAIYFIISCIRKKDNYTVQIAFGITLFILNSSYVVLSSLVGKTEILNIVLAIIWAIYAILSYYQQRVCEKEIARFQKDFQEFQNIIQNFYDEKFYESLDFKDETLTEFEGNSTGSERQQTFDCKIVD